MKFEGDHNSQRPHFFFDSVVIFFHNTLQVSQLCREDNRVQKASAIGPKVNNIGSGPQAFMD